MSPFVVRGHDTELCEFGSCPQQRRNQPAAFQPVDVSKSKSGCRDGAAASLKLKHIDCAQRVVLQDPREVQTKFGKTITTFFFPVGEEAVRILTDWVSELVTEHLWGPDDPLFPATAMARSETGGFRPAGIKRANWSNADPVRRIFKVAFGRSGLPSFEPHSFRHMLSRLGEKVCKSPEEWKAWSQNLGHENVHTTFSSYGHVEEHRQGEIFRRLRQPGPSDDNLLDLLQKFVAEAQRR